MQIYNTLEIIDEHIINRLENILHVKYEGILEGWRGSPAWTGHYLLSVDGTGYFSSSRVHCAQCCEKHHRDGRTTYYHQMLGAVLVHPDKREGLRLGAGANREGGRGEEERL